MEWNNWKMEWNNWKMEWNNLLQDVKNIENDLILKKARITELEILLFEKPL